MMGRYVSVKGWLSCDSEIVPKIKEIAESFLKNYTNFSITLEERTLYNKGWRYPTEDTWQYVFYGADLKSYYVEYIKLQVEAISGIDSDIEGTFFIDDEDGEERYLWRVSDGTFEETKREE
jgi:hypothetical protein